MADEDVVVAEVEAPPIEPNNPIADFLNSVEGQEFTTAEKQFNDMIGDRLQAQLDQAKAAIAGQIYGQAEVDAARAEVEGEMDLEDEEVVDGTLDDLDIEPEDEVELTDDEMDADDENVAGV